MRWRITALLLLILTVSHHMIMGILFGNMRYVWSREKFEFL